MVLWHLSSFIRMLLPTACTLLRPIFPLKSISDDWTVTLGDNRFDTSKLNMSEFKARLDYLEFTESDAKLLKSLKPWADSIAEGFVKKFYDKQFNQQGFLRIIEKAGSNRRTLEGAQAGYLKSLFEGVLDAQYVAMRQHIGGLHARIGVTPEWYIASYQWYTELLYPMVRSKLKLRRGAGTKATNAIAKLLTFDQAVIMDEYVNGLLNQLKVVIDKVGDTATSLNDSSQQMSNAAEQAG